MDTYAQTTFPAAVTSPKKRSARAIADKSLTAATRFWFAVVLIGQAVFAVAVASYYGVGALRGHTRQAWSKHISHGYVTGDTIGNLAVALHLFSAAVIIVAGLIQLFPQIRARAPWLHRWNGRLYIVVAFTVSLAGLYMMWIRGGVGDLPQHIGTGIMALLIMLCAVMAMRYAMARDFRTHRRWALRLYIVVSASLFIRTGLFLSVILNHGPFGFDPATFTGPFLTFISFAQYLIPLAVLEIYLYTQERSGAPGRFAMAGSLFVLTLGLAVGVTAVIMVVWIPQIRTAYDSRKSIAAALSATIASSGIDGAAKRYHELKLTQPAAYNFDQVELNTLGYELIQSKKYQEAIRIFELNVETYPKSSNAYDSLGEAHQDAGDKPRAIASYQKALALNPKNVGAAKALEKLKVR